VAQALTLFARLSGTRGTEQSAVRDGV
jgi:hypothetical protein